MECLLEKGVASIVDILHNLINSEEDQVLGDNLSNIEAKVLKKEWGNDTIARNQCGCLPQARA
jgi:hypothetical protein